MDSSCNTRCDDVHGLEHVLGLEVSSATHLHGALAVARAILNPNHRSDALASGDLGGWRRSADRPLTRNQQSPPVGTKTSPIRLSERCEFREKLETLQ